MHVFLLLGWLEVAAALCSHREGAARDTPGKMQAAFLAERSRGNPGQAGQAGPRTGHSMYLMQGPSSADVMQAGTGPRKLLGLGCASLNGVEELPGEVRADGDSPRGKIQ